MRNEWNRGCTSHAAFHAEFIAGAAANVGASDLRIQAEILFNIFSHPATDSRVISIPTLLESISACFRKCLDEEAANELKRKRATDFPQHISSC